MEARKKIIGCIEKSTDEKLTYLDKKLIKIINYEDVMDVILLYISFSLKNKPIDRMSGSDFYTLSEVIFNKWSREEENKEFSHLCGSYCNGPGPMGGTASSAEMYFLYRMKITCFEDIQKFFIHPKNTRYGWKYYRDIKVLPRTLPKWRRPSNFEKINQVFTLAEIFCKEIQNHKAEK